MSFLNNTTMLIYEKFNFMVLLKMINIKTIFQNDLWKEKYEIIETVDFACSWKKKLNLSILKSWDFSAHMQHICLLSNHYMFRVWFWDIFCQSKVHGKVYGISLFQKQEPTFTCIMLYLEIYF